MFVSYYHITQYMTDHSDTLSLSLYFYFFAEEKRILLYNVDSRMRNINTKWAYKKQ